MGKVGVRQSSLTTHPVCIPLCIMYASRVHTHSGVCRRTFSCITTGARAYGGFFLLRFIVTDRLLRRLTFLRGHVSPVRTHGVHDLPFFFIARNFPVLLLYRTPSSRVVAMQVGRADESGVEGTFSSSVTVYRRFYETRVSRSIFFSPPPPPPVIFLFHKYFIRVRRFDSLF